MDTYVHQDAEPIYVERDGRKEPYTQRFLSVVTIGGMMVHSRLHSQPHTIDEQRQYVMVTDSLYDSEPEQFWHAASRRRHFGGGVAEQTEVTATEFIRHGLGPRAVRPCEEPSDTTEYLLDQALERVGVPQMTYGAAGWRYRVGPGQFDDMYDIHTVHRDVLALRAELATAAVTRVAEQDFQLTPTGSDL